MKLAVIGGASSYTPELVDGLFPRIEQIPVTEVWLMDPNAERLEITAGLSQRMSDNNGNPFKVYRTGDMREAVKDAAYVVTQLRVGQIQARITDEKLGLKYGIVGQETTGVGGFACALRTIPRLLDIAHAMEELSPEGFLINFTNPSGIVSEALFRHSAIRSVGLCNVPINIIMEVTKHFGCAMEDVQLDYVGLNHLAWIRHFFVQGADITDKVFADLDKWAEEEWEEAPIRESMLTAMRTLKTFCNGYLQYYYATEPMLAHLKAKATTRGEDVIEVEKKLFAKYASPDLKEKPEELMERGGAYYSTAALNLIASIQNDTQNKQIVVCPNRGAVPGFDDDASVEITATIGRDGAVGVPQLAPDPSIRGLMQVVKAYETLTVEAAVKGDRERALQAVLMHPLMPEATHAKELLDELLEVNKQHLQGTFF